MLKTSRSAARSPVNQCIMPRVQHPGDVRAATLLLQARLQRPSFQGPAAAAAAAAAQVLSSAPCCFGLRIAFLALRPPSLLSSRPPDPPFYWAEFQMPGGPRLTASSESRQRARPRARTRRLGLRKGTRLSSNSHPATLPSHPRQEKRGPGGAPREPPSLTPPPAGCWDGREAVRAGRELGGPRGQ